MGQIVEAPVGLQPGATGHICTDCGENLTYGEEIWFLRVVQPQKLNGSMYFHPIINEEDVEGGFVFEPYYFCFKCWEKVYEGLREDVKDEPPLLDLQADFDCTACSSGIRSWEYSGAFTVGEFHPSKRAPNGQRGPIFQPNSKTELLCLYCLSVINDSYITMWDNGLSHQGECVDCIQVRCWRGEPDTCACTCHKEEDDTETE